MKYLLGNIQKDDSLQEPEVETFDINARHHLGVMLVNASPMKREEFERYQRAFGKEGLEPDEPGFLVEYEDSTKANNVNHNGFVFWMPQDVFLRTFQTINGRQIFDLIKR